MTDKEIRTKYNLDEFSKVDEFEFDMPSHDEMMTDHELLVAVYGTDDEEELDELEAKDYENKFFDIAIRDYGHKYLGGSTVEHLESDYGESLWHTAGTLYMTANDSGLKYDLYFDHEPDEDDVIKAICLANDIQ